VICCVDLPTFSMLMPSRNGTWIGAYESVMMRLVGMAPLGALVVGDKIVGLGQW
jgi:hypothetical protein